MELYIPNTWNEWCTYQEFVKSLHPDINSETPFIPTITPDLFYMLKRSRLYTDEENSVKIRKLEENDSEKIYTLDFEPQIDCQDIIIAIDKDVSPGEDNYTIMLSYDRQYNGNDYRYCYWFSISSMEQPNPDGTRISISESECHIVNPRYGKVTISGEEFFNRTIISATRGEQYKVTIEVDEANIEQPNIGDVLTLPLNEEIALQAYLLFTSHLEISPEAKKEDIRNITATINKCIGWAAPSLNRLNTSIILEKDGRKIALEVYDNRQKKRKKKTRQ